MEKQLMFFKLLRIYQWNKNLFVFAPLVFSKRLFEYQSLVGVIAAFFLFSVASSSVYIFNDIWDIESDRQHPHKSSRPIASGKISIRYAAGVATILCVTSLFFSFQMKMIFGLIVFGYIILNILYSIAVKNIVILDVMSIAAGFVLRVMGGAEIIDVYPSNWLIVCTILLALFLGFSKRRHELVLLTGEASTHRKVLEHYSTYFLDQMISVVTASSILSYLLYTVSDETVNFFGTRKLLWTAPFVLYGIFRYLYLVHKEEKGEDPSKIMFKDKPLLINILLWGISCIVIIYKR